MALEPNVVPPWGQMFYVLDIYRKNINSPFLSKTTRLRALIFSILHLPSWSNDVLRAKNGPSWGSQLLFRNVVREPTLKLIEVIFL